MSEENGLFVFTQELIKLLDKLNKEHANQKQAWFSLQQFYLSFAGRCDDAGLRDEAFKLIKNLAEKIPLPQESEGKGLEEPLPSVSKIEEQILKLRSGRKLTPGEIK